MPDYSYSFQKYEKSRHVRAAIRDKSISHKHSREIAIVYKQQEYRKSKGVPGGCFDKKNSSTLSEI